MSVKLKVIQEKFKEELKAIYPKEEINSFFFIAIEHYVKLTRLQFALEPDYQITAEKHQQLQNVLEQLKAEKPIQYIIGETEFYGLPFQVNENVLIPRPETEELVEWIIARLSVVSGQWAENQQRTTSNEQLEKNCQQPTTNNQQLNILDIGTGSGCIAIALAKQLPKAKVYAVDVSEEALEVAKQNAKHNTVAVEFIHANILEESHPEYSQGIFNKIEKFDVIVSNPPYVRELEKAEMKTNVLDNEPHLALFVKDDNPLVFYDAITKFAVDKLRANGRLFFEINQYLGEEMIQLLETHHFKTIELRKDLFGRDRMICGILQ